MVHWVWQHITESQFEQNLLELAHSPTPTPTLFLDLLAEASTDGQRARILEHLNISIGYASGRGYVLEEVLVASNPRTPSQILDEHGAAASILRAFNRYLLHEPQGYWQPAPEDLDYQKEQQGVLLQTLADHQDSPLPEGILSLANAAISPIPVRVNRTEEFRRREHLKAEAEVKKLQRIPALLLLVSHLERWPHLYIEALRFLHTAAQKEAYLHRGAISHEELQSLSRSPDSQEKLDMLAGEVVAHFDVLSRTPAAEAELAAIHRRVFEHRHNALLQNQPAHRFLLQHRYDISPSGKPRLAASRFVRKLARQVWDGLYSSSPRRPVAPPRAPPRLTLVH